MKTINCTLLFLALTTWSTAFAQSESFKIDLARISGEVECNVSRASSKEIDCQISIKGRNKIEIVLHRQEEDGKIEYKGNEIYLYKNTDYILVLEANESKKLQSLTLATKSKGSNPNHEKMNLTKIKTDQVRALQVSPLTLDLSSEDQVNVALSFVIYESGWNPNSFSQSNKNYQEFVLKQIRPALELIGLQL